MDEMLSNWRDGTTCDDMPYDESSMTAERNSPASVSDKQFIVNS